MVFGIKVENDLISRLSELQTIVSKQIESLGKYTYDSFRLEKEFPFLTHSDVVHSTQNKGQKRQACRERSKHR